MKLSRDTGGTLHPKVASVRMSKDGHPNLPNKRPKAHKVDMYANWRQSESHVCNAGLKAGTVKYCMYY